MCIINNISTALGEQWGTCFLIETTETKTTHHKETKNEVVVSLCKLKLNNYYINARSTAHDSLHEQTKPVDIIFTCKLVGRP